jgi:hypothetical protein
MMAQKTLHEILAEDPGSVEAVLTAIAELRTEVVSGAIEDWENPTLEQFLEGMHAWLETMGPRVGKEPSWKFIELMLRAAKIYE